MNNARHTGRYKIRDPVGTSVIHEILLETVPDESPTESSPGAVTATQEPEVGMESWGPERWTSPLCGVKKDGVGRDGDHRVGRDGCRSVGPSRGLSSGPGVTYRRGKS